jgi:hypothetical protein
LEVFRKLAERNFIGGELENAELRHEQIRELLDFLGRRQKKKRTEEEEKEEE